MIFKGDIMEEINKKIEVPFVFIKESDGFHGFVPGIIKRDIVDKEFVKCLYRLEHDIELLVKQMKATDQIPFFPTDEEIYRDFDNVYKIIRKYI